MHKGLKSFRLLQDQRSLTKYWRVGNHRYALNLFAVLQHKHDWFYRRNWDGIHNWVIWGISSWKDSTMSHTVCNLPSKLHYIMMKIQLIDTLTHSNLFIWRGRRIFFLQTFCGSTFWIAHSLYVYMIYHCSCTCFAEKDTKSWINTTMDHYVLIKTWVLQVTVDLWYHSQVIYFSFHWIKEAVKGKLCTLMLKVHSDHKGFYR